VAEHARQLDPDSEIGALRPILRPLPPFADRTAIDRRIASRLCALCYGVDYALSPPVYLQFMEAQFWVSEYGSAKDPDPFKWLYAYSPYQHVKPGTKYPAVLFMTGDGDTRAWLLCTGVKWRRCYRRAQVRTGRSCFVTNSQQDIRAGVP